MASRTASTMTPEQYRTARERCGTQAQVAELLGLSRITIIRREAGELPITKEAALAIRSLKPPRA